MFLLFSNLLVHKTLLALLVCCLVDGRLVFPPGSDVGYIVPDAPSLQRVAEVLTRSADPRHNDVHDLHLSRKVRNEPPLNSLAGYNDLWLPHDIDDTNKGYNSLASDFGSIPSYLRDDRQGIKMGVSDSSCDDAKTNLIMDWDFSPANYTCYNPRSALPPSSAPALLSLLKCDTVSDEYRPQHFCMDQKIEYEDRVPTHGDHRPLWPQFGEYRFVPSQRWLHSIEHGSVVMLYHPCTRPHLVDRLRSLVTSCLYKHVITPYTPLTPSRPLALVAWGCVLEMGAVNEEEVKAFIKNRALKGPEGEYRKQGVFTEGLVKSSSMPGGKSDEGLVLCPE